MVCLASDSRAAMVLRMPSSLISSYSRPSYIRATMSAEGPAGAAATGAGAAAAGAAAGVAAVAGAAVAPSTSAFTIRPRGPEPLMAARSSPFWAAIRRASGEAKMRLPSAPAGAAGAGAGAAAAAGAAAGAAGADASAGAAEAAGAGLAATSPALSPSPRSTAIGVFTFTPSVPSATRILPITPSSTASNSIVALSVSISARRSPELTSSPSLTSHFASVPSSIVGERAGMRISVGMMRSP